LSDERSIAGANEGYRRRMADIGAYLEELPISRYLK